MSPHDQVELSLRRAASSPYDRGRFVCTRRYRAPDHGAFTRKKLVFDFSNSPNGGVAAGTFDNFAFVLDLNRPQQKLTVKPGQQRKDVIVIATFDYADCSKNQESLLERTVNGLAAGTATFVDYVDIEIIPTNQKDLIWNGCA